MSKARAHILITGRVQGVYFRSYTRAEAEKFNLSGWVRNSIGGSVEIVAEGEKKDIEKLIAWCHKGPSSANVVNVEVEWHEYKGEFDRFSIEYARH
ncbi:MAG: acylphosphatase [Patescibacteria group bacterium]